VQQMEDAMAAANRINPEARAGLKIV
jgi:hypothetical protein